MQAGEKVFGGLCTEDIVPTKIVRLSNVRTAHERPPPPPPPPPPLFETVAALLRRKRKRVIYNFNYVEFASRLSYLAAA